MSCRKPNIKDNLHYIVPFISECHLLPSRMCCPLGLYTDFEHAVVGSYTSGNSFLVPEHYGNFVFTSRLVRGKTRTSYSWRPLCPSLSTHWGPRYESLGKNVYQTRDRVQREDTLNPILVLSHPFLDLYTQTFYRNRIIFPLTLSSVSSTFQTKNLLRFSSLVTFVTNESRLRVRRRLSLKQI